MHLHNIMPNVTIMNFNFKFVLIRRENVKNRFYVGLTNAIRKNFFYQNIRVRHCKEE